jgi:hypothetical protein
MAAKKKPAETTTAPLRRRMCGTMAAHMRLLEMFPQFRARQFQLEQEYQQRRTRGLRAADMKRVTIRVVVNVVANTDEQDVSDAQVKSQIAALNLDFGAKNKDRESVPVPWTGLVTDAKVRFKLVKVVRRRTTKAGFDADDSVKGSATGGVGPFQPQKHLNFWVCPLAGGLLGYAQFPGGPAQTDGVVIDWRCFGTKGTAQGPFNLGRTATHEVGHYLNLRHIWGDTEDCSGTDFVADTPNAAGPNFGKPAFPSVSCNNGPNGDMFVNYMDYVDDAAMFMFTAQQVLRMRTALDGPRSGIF